MGEQSIDERIDELTRRIQRQHRPATLNEQRGVRHKPGDLIVSEADRRTYRVTNGGGTLRHAQPKLRGKRARKDERALRRRLRAHGHTIAPWK